MAIPAPPRKTLLEWIDSDDSNEPDIIPATGTRASASMQLLHAAIVFAPKDGPSEPLAPPPGLALAPLG